MLRRSLALATLLLGLTSLCPGVSAAPQVFKEPRIGFQIKVPKKWSQVPTAADEVYIAAKYLSKKEDSYTRSDFGYTFQHRPSLRCVAFVHSYLKSAEERGDDDEDDEDDEDDDEGSSTITIILKRILRDYQHFLKETNTGEGWFITDEKTVKVGDFDVTQYTIRLPEAVPEANRLLITWVFPGEFADVAVEFEVLEDKYKDYKSQIERTMKSFTHIERTEPFEPSSSTAAFISYYGSKKMTPKERADQRKKQETTHWEGMKRALPAGWSTYDIDGVHVISRHDEKHAKSVVKSIVGVIDWADDKFPAVGPSEYVRRPLVRICKDQEEEREFLLESTGFSMGGTELVTHKSNVGATSWEWEYINWRTFHIWFWDRDPELWLALPAWARSGLEEVIESAKPKGSKLKFSKDDWEQGWRGSDNQIHLRTLMMMTREQFGESRGDAGYAPRSQYQAAALVRYLLDGKGSKGKNKSLFSDYLANVRYAIDVLDQEEKGKDKERYKAPETEEEENAMFQARQERFAEREARILEMAFERTFGEWKPAKFSSFEKSYLKSIK